MSDYLWDKSGPPDPEVERLERELSRYRWKGGAPPKIESHRGSGWVIAACAILAAAGAWLSTRGPGGEREVWTLAREGAVAIPIRAGEWIDTGDGIRARLSVGRIGEVDIEAASRLRVDGTRGQERQVTLERGQITAMIYSPARTFVVETPSARAIDLGCRYVLSVDENGNGRVRVILGWVGFERDGHEVFIPEGAVCETRKSGGLGTPYYSDATAEFQAALSGFDFSGAALKPVLDQARRRDAVTLWHILGKATDRDREATFARLAVLVPPPQGVTREAILRGDSRARDLWWNAFGLEGIDWWRKWKGLLPPP